jgi:hypothetical protein
MVQIHAFTEGIRAATENAGDAGSTAAPPLSSRMPEDHYIPW